ncbi:MAG: DUF2442 domain-containing protein [Gemmataceae bacterium]|nr:DUF2442 domain-containing protein [Gemmataceae bacterium]
MNGYARSQPFFGIIIRKKMTMPHPIYRVRSFEIVAPYTLRVQFDDQTEQIINFEPILAGEPYRPLRDLSQFNQVRIDPEVKTLVWPNGADFDPATLHDWPAHVQALTERARQWELTPA